MPDLFICHHYLLALGICTTCLHYNLASLNFFNIWMKFIEHRSKGKGTYPYLTLPLPPIFEYKSVCHSLYPICRDIVLPQILPSGNTLIGKPYLSMSFMPTKMSYKNQAFSPKTNTSFTWRLIQEVTPSTSLMWSSRILPADKMGPLLKCLKHKKATQTTTRKHRQTQEWLRKELMLLQTRQIGIKKPKL